MPPHLESEAMELIHQRVLSTNDSIVRARIESGEDILMESYREYPLLRADFINYSLTNLQERRVVVDFLASWMTLSEACGHPFFHAHATYEVGYHRLRPVCFYADTDQEIDRSYPAFVHSDHLYGLWERTNPDFLLKEKVVCVQHNRPEEVSVTTELTPLVASVLGRLSTTLSWSSDRIISSGGSILNGFLDKFAK
jgi:hypothetical protein